MFQEVMGYHVGCDQSENRVMRLHFAPVTRTARSPATRWATVVATYEPPDRSAAG